MLTDKQLMTSWVLTALLSNFQQSESITISSFQLNGIKGISLIKDWFKTNLVYRAEGLQITNVVSSAAAVVFRMSR